MSARKSTTPRFSTSEGERIFARSLVNDQAAPSRPCWTADLYPGEAKPDKRDAYVIAETGRTRRKHCTGSMPAPTISSNAFGS
jgi:hypothetical protein